MERPDLSIVVLTYERPPLLGRCLASLSAQGTSATIEIVAADDGSGPQTEAVVAERAAADARIRHVRHDHRGIAAARNLGVAAARGRFVAIVADDYELAPHYAAVALGYLEAHPRAAVVRFDVLPAGDSWGARASHLHHAAGIGRRLAAEALPEPVGLRGRLRFYRDGPRWSAPQLGLRTGALEASGAAVFRREVLDAVGGWDETHERSEDSEHSVRLRDQGFEIHYLPAGTVRHAYRPLPFDTVRKLFQTGRQFGRLAPRPPRAGGAANVLWALRSAPSPAQAVVALPWLCVFELAFSAGAWQGRHRAAAQTRAARGRAAGADPSRR
ncbi:unannotated protein [freshwater metagenome]|uniref:Unannotated protein n=1 Tax=freshwater metagenome TaxID=449393 RepID=A0A6J7H2M1_9ZZZZ|nr:glycosyltransferase [Actinomycetota bacterium]